MIFNPTRYAILAKFSKEIFQIPSQTGTLTYNGSVQSPTWNNYNPSYMTISGDTSATDAGTYTVTFSLNDKEKYTWADYTTDNKIVNWTIQRGIISNVPYQSGTLTYNGSSLSPTWNSYDSFKMTISGTTSAIEVGTYAVTFTPTSNYQWNDGTTIPKNVTWEIIGLKSTTLIVSPTHITLNSTNQSASITIQTNIRTYHFDGYDENLIYLTSYEEALKKDIWYVVSNGISGNTAITITAGGAESGYEEKSVTVYVTADFSSSKNPNTITLNPDSITLNGYGDSKTIQVSRLGDGAITAYSYDPSIADVNVSGTTVTVTCMTQAEYAMTEIYINVAETNEYASATATATATVSSSGGNTEPTPSLPDGISVNPTSISLNGFGDSKTVQVTTVESMGFNVNIPYEHMNHLSVQWDANEGGHGGTILFTQLEDIPATFSVPIVFSSSDTVYITVFLSGGSTAPTPTPSGRSINPTSISISGVGDSKTIQVTDISSTGGFNVSIPFEHTIHLSSQVQMNSANSYTVLFTQLANISTTFDVPIIFYSPSETMTLTVSLSST